MARQIKRELSGLQKAAVFLISLGPELSSQVLKFMRDDEIEQLTLEIANMGRFPDELRDKVFEEFQQLCAAQQYLSQGGIQYAKDVLEKALGSQKASEIINRLTSNLQVRPFDFVRKADPAHLLNFIQGEHPQTIALILAYLQPEQSSIVMSGLPPERQVDVAKRIALMDRTSPEVIRDIEQVLEKKLSTVLTQDFTTTGGIGSVVDILNRVDRGTERTIIENLEIQDPELAEEIKRRMFVFEDVVILDDRSIQRVLREVDMKDLALALKGSSEEVADLIYRNMSSRASQMLKEDIEFLGPVRLRDVEETQQKIVSIIRRLEESGEIIISRGGGDELIV